MRSKREETGGKPPRVRGFSDLATEEDLLGARDYFSGLAEFIRTCATPMTLAIQGDWGSGKTTALKNIQRILHDGDGAARYPILWFDTWSFAHVGVKDKMAIYLALHMLVRLKELAGADPGKRMAVAAGLKRVLDVGKMISVSYLDATFGAPVADFVQEALRGRKEDSEAVQLTRLRSEIESCVEKVLGGDPDNRLVVFVDDMDRLQPADAVNLMEGMKIFLDCRRCVFVLAVDDSVVLTGLRKKYGDEMDESKARQFFEKLIQAPFYLPVASYDLGSYLRQFLPKAPGEIPRYREALLAILGSNPRNIKRAFNILSLYDCIFPEGPDRRYLRFVLILLQMREKGEYLSLSGAAVAAAGDREQFRAELEALAEDCGAVGKLRKLLLEQQAWAEDRLLDDLMALLRASSAMDGASREVTALLRDSPDAYRIVKTLARDYLVRERAGQEGQTYVEIRERRGENPLRASLSLKPDGRVNLVAYRLEGESPLGAPYRFPVFDGRRVQSPPCLTQAAGVICKGAEGDSHVTVLDVGGLDPEALRAVLEFFSLLPPGRKEEPLP